MKKWFVTTHRGETLEVIEWDECGYICKHIDTGSISLPCFIHDDDIVLKIKCVIK